jgi:hypothetical protein
VPLTHEQRRELIERALPPIHIAGHSHGGTPIGWDGSRSQHQKALQLMQWDDWRNYRDQGYQP